MEILSDDLPPPFRDDRNKINHDFATFQANWPRFRSAKRPDDPLIVILIAIRLTLPISKEWKPTEGCYGNQIEYAWLEWVRKPFRLVLDPGLWGIPSGPLIVATFEGPWDKRCEPEQDPAYGMNRTYPDTFRYVSTPMAPMGKPTTRRNQLLHVQALEFLNRE